MIKSGRHGLRHCLSFIKDSDVAAPIAMCVCALQLTHIPPPPPPLTACIRALQHTHPHTPTHTPTHTPPLTPSPRANVLSDARRLGRLDHLGIRRVQSTISNVMFDRIIEQHHVLWNHPDGPPEALLGDMANVGPIDANSTGQRVVESEEEAENGRLAGPRGAHERHLPAAGDVEGDAVQGEHPGRELGGDGASDMAIQSLRGWDE